MSGLKSQTITVKVEPWKAPAGHLPHRSGNGVHKDKRTRRLRTRGAASRRAIGAE